MFKRLIFWDFPRGSWQYDVVVGLILAFIFLTPREWFRDQPRVPDASSITVLDREVYWVEPELLAGVPESERPGRLSSILTAHFRQPVEITKVDPVFNSEHELKGYAALSKR
jgi:hypothetical protein